MVFVLSPVCADGSKPPRGRSFKAPTGTKWRKQAISLKCPAQAMLSEMAILQQSGRKLILARTAATQGWPFTRGRPHTPEDYSNVCLEYAQPVIRHPACVRLRATAKDAVSLIDLPCCLYIYVSGATKYARSPFTSTVWGVPSTPSTGVISLLIVICEISLPPICACSFALPLMRWKFVED